MDLVEVFDAVAAKSKTQIFKQKIIAMATVFFQ